jgi:replicative DNA helicase
MTAAPIRSPFNPQKSELGKLFDKLPPQALEMEMHVLGAMILDRSVCGEVVQILKGPDDFYKPAHAAIYQVLVSLYDQNQPTDLVQINQKLRDLGQLESVGGTDYLVSLAESVPSAASAAYSARAVRDKAVLRQLIDAAGKILVQAYGSADAAVAQVDLAEQQIFRLAEFQAPDQATDIGKLVDEEYHRLEAMDGQYLNGLDTGFLDLNKLTGGLQKGEMVIVAGRPSMGKTAFALNIAEHLAVVAKQPVAVFSLEMSKQQLAQRLLCSRSGVNSQRLRSNTLGGDEFNKLAHAAGELTGAPMYIDDTPALSLLALRAKARRLAARFDIKALFVDYLQLMTCVGSESRQQEVSEISRGLKALARELNVPVVCLSQLNRQPEAREGHRPRMGDLRESGAIEQDADVVLMLHRESYFHNEPEWAQEHPDEINLAEAIIAKNRNGPTDTVRLTFDGNTTRFHNLAPGAAGSSAAAF